MLLSYPADRPGLPSPVCNFLCHFFGLGRERYQSKPLTFWPLPCKKDCKREVGDEYAELDLDRAAVVIGRLRETEFS
jgi:hypothetical protein